MNKKQIKGKQIKDQEFKKIRDRIKRQKFGYSFVFIFLKFNRKDKKVGL
jgi:hypothetical protein